MLDTIYESVKDKGYPDEVTIESRTDDLDVMVRDVKTGKTSLVTKSNFAKYFKPKKEESK